MRKYNILKTGLYANLFFDGVSVGHLKKSAVLLSVFTFSVPCCDVRCSFRIKTMVGSSLPSVVLRRTYVLFTLFVCVCVYWCATHIVLCLCSAYVSLDCPFMIAPLVFSIVDIDDKYAFRE